MLFPPLQAASSNTAAVAVAVTTAVAVVLLLQDLRYKLTPTTMQCEKWCYKFAFEYSLRCTLNIK